MTDVWPRCGHPKTPQNTSAIGRFRSPCCRTCQSIAGRHSRTGRFATKDGLNREERLNLASKVERELRQARREMLERISA